MVGLIFFLFFFFFNIESAMKLHNVHTQFSVAPGVDTVAVSLTTSISVIGLIIGASISAGSGHAARILPC